jgi:hypothetical protein
MPVRGWTSRRAACMLRAVSGPAIGSQPVRGVASRHAAWFRLARQIRIRMARPWRPAARMSPNVTPFRVRGKPPKILQNPLAVSRARPRPFSAGLRRRRDGSASGAIAFLVSFCQARRTAGQRQTHGRGAWWAKAVPRMESVPITTE